MSRVRGAPVLTIIALLLSLAMASSYYLEDYWPYVGGAAELIGYACLIAGPIAFVGFVESFF